MRGAEGRSGGGVDVDEGKSCTIAIALRTLRSYEAKPRLVPRGARAWQTFDTRSGLSDTRRGRPNARYWHEQ